MDGRTVLYQEPALKIRFEEEECFSTRKGALFEASTSFTFVALSLRSYSNVRLPFGLKGSKDLMWSSMVNRIFSVGAILRAYN